MKLGAPSEPTPLAPNLMHCPDCGHAVSKHANSCPKCGRAIQASAGRIIWKVFFWLIVLSGIGAIFQQMGNQ